jgi:antitoxin MazE
MPRTISHASKREAAQRAELVRLTVRGTLTLPRRVRQGLDKEQLFEVDRREDGVIELRPRALVDPSQAWFWSAKWQQMEREADEDIAAGRVKRFDSMEELFADLDSPTSE